MSAHDRPETPPTPDSTRRALRAWELEKAANHFTADVDLHRILRHHLGGAALDAEWPGLAAFGEESATDIDALVRENNRDENLPQLRRWDGFGHRTEQVVFHPSYAEIGRRIYRTGVIARYAERGRDRVQMAYAYLVGHHGEGGHLCPLACTAGLVKILQARADDALKARLLPGLFHLDRTDPAHFHGAQFLTEIQGGSDVGANAVVARETPAGWTVSGEKWFCSVIDADLYLVTARPEGAPRAPRASVRSSCPDCAPMAAPTASTCAG
jgi:alkylation response protein AidB-like acyl-CoA dehydrogenase